MPRADNTAYLARAAAQRHQDALSRANNTLKHLKHTGQPVTFTAVAAAAGVSRSWLYRHPEITDQIARLRNASTQPGTTPPAQRATTESLRARLDSYHAEITRLRAENATLREQVARRLGHQRAAPTNAHSTSSKPTSTHPEPHVNDMSTTQKRAPTRVSPLRA